MKTQIVSINIIILMVGTLLTGCGEKTKQDATEVKEDLKEFNKDLFQGTKDTAEEIKIAITEDWKKFKTASENAIEKTEKDIKILRERIKKNNKKEHIKLTKKLDELEQKNIILKDKLAVRTKKLKENRIEFNENTKESEKEFEREFDHGIKELNNALKDFIKQNL